MTEYIKAMRKFIGHERLIIVGAGVFVYRDGKVLLQQRKDNGCWADHGGCVEVGESVENTARRELYEETGLIAQDLTFMGIYSGEDMLYTYPNGDQVYIVGTYWICTQFAGEEKIDYSEVSALQWFDLDNLPEKISPPSQRPLCDFVSKMKQ